MSRRGVALARVGLLLIATTLVGCDRGGDRPGNAGGSAGASAPVVTADAGSLVFSWLDDDGDFQTATRIEDVPEKRRAKVRVQDTAGPPPDPGFVWIADLRKASGGVYPVRRTERSEFDRRAAPPPAVEPSKVPTAAPSGPSAADRPAVVMYMTSTCPVCRRARSWLNRNNVSYVERDIGRDSAAARELQEKAARQGVRADGVPVFDVRGKLIPGFDQARLRRELGL